MRVLLGLAAAVTLSACTFAASPSGAQAPEAAAITLTAAATAETLQPETDGEPIQWAASVTRVDYLEDQGDTTVKLFGMAGGDPAMNGLYTEIAFFQGPADGWRVFRIGDFLDYRIVGSSRGRVDLEINESVMNEASGDIGSRTRHVIVTWTYGAEGEAPATISVTPANAS